LDAAERSSVPDVGVLVAGRYRITGILGQGGMGLVLSARDEKDGRDVALKLLQAIGEANTERFLREARVAAKLESEHIVKVLDVGSRAGRPYLVMERLRGEDFSSLMRGSGSGQEPTLSPLSLVEVADCVVQTCEALAHAHGAGVIHRDIKASNLFAHQREDGSRIVKVLDFGISKVLGGTGEPERTLTRTIDGLALGSPPYMSPEHARDARKVDRRSDIWSLGVVAYRLLSARYPFAGESATEVLAASLRKPPVRLRDLGLDVPDAVDAIIARCLAPDPDERFADAGALAAAFSPFTSERWRGYAQVVQEIVGRTPGPASPRIQGGAPKLADARALLDDPPTRSLAPEPDASNIPDRADLRTSVTRLMPDRPGASPPQVGATRVPPEAPAPPARRGVRGALAAIVFAAIVAIAFVARTRAKPHSASQPIVAAPVASTATAFGLQPESSAAPEVSPAPPLAPAASVNTPPGAPRATRRRAPTTPPSAAPPAPLASEAPRPVLQPNPYAH
jgi:serine/threonine-protein kinase